VPAFSQDATLPTNEVNITLNQAPVRTALDTLFKSASLNYTIDPSVNGLVTVSLRAIPFDVALRSILRSADPPLAYTITDGVYNVHPRVQQVEITSGTQPVVTAASTDQTSQSTVMQVVPIHLLYANASTLLRSALMGTTPGSTGFIQPLNTPQTSFGGSSMSGGMGGMSGGMGGMSGGMGGMTGGMGGMTGGMGGMTGGMGGMTGGTGF
jgi:type II secretory pathway component HofQ